MVRSYALELIARKLHKLAKIRKLFFLLLTSSKALAKLFFFFFSNSNWKTWRGKNSHRNINKCSSFILRIFVFLTFKFDFFSEVLSLNTFKQRPFPFKIWTFVDFFKLKFVKHNSKLYLLVLKTHLIPFQKLFYCLLWLYSLCQITGKIRISYQISY